MTTEQILSVLRDTPGRLSDFAADLTEAQLHARPEPGEWSVTEIVAHLRSCCDVWGDAIEMIIATEHPTVRAVSPTTWVKSTDYAELEFASSLQAFARQRDRLLATLGQLPVQGWSRSATVLGGGRPIELTVHSYASRLARHERGHWRQVAKTVTAVARAEPRPKEAGSAEPRGDPAQRAAAS
ncbi:MAG TPA: DinB family protein [Streptosporangiaceae bacterium]|nr:DinB family protein [Streptosporangiaceae bacterium]